MRGFFLAISSLLFVVQFLRIEPVYAQSIGNTADHQAYLAAVNPKDTKVRIARLEWFVSGYPKSKDLEPALQSLLEAYQQRGDTSKVMDTAQRLLLVNPDNLSALAMLSMRCRFLDDPPSQTVIDQEEAKCSGDAKRGLKALDVYVRPADMSQQDYEKTKKGFRALFAEQIGTSALLMEDYVQAQKFLEMAIVDKQAGFSVIYPLALAYLNAAEPDCAKGLWYLARSIALAPVQDTRRVLADWGHKKASELHVKDKDWSGVISEAAKSQTPTPEFQINCSAR